MNTYNGPIEEVKLVEKVTLTKEQANAMKVFLDDNGNDKEHLVDWFVANRDFRHSVDIEYRGLADLKTSTLSKALYIGYEIEQPNFYIGDKVVTPHQGIMPVHDVLGDVLVFMGGGYMYKKETCHHATAEEIFWLKTLGRKKVMDFRGGDVLMDEDGSAYSLDIQMSEKEIIKLYKEGNYFVGLYPAEAFRPFPKEGVRLPGS